MYVLVIFMLLTIVRAQQSPCSCSCCTGLSCTSVSLPTVYVQYCTLETCLAQCRATYSQCQVPLPYGQVSAQCGSNIGPQYYCRCDCCNTGSTSCSPSFVGYALVYSCQTGACSIECNRQYSSQCVVTQNGQTQGTCIGLITTTSTITTIGPWLGNTCSCMCCQTGSYCSPTYVGTTSASQCSSTTCTQACRTRYPSSCPSSTSIGQTMGTCTSTTTGNTRCKCYCCGTNGCINYDINTSGDCSTCDSSCRVQAPCINTQQVTQTCTFNNKARRLKQFSLRWVIFIITILFSSFF
jgi:hypothetical protein